MASSYTATRTPLAFLLRHIIPQGAHLLIIINKAATYHFSATFPDQKCSTYQINLKFKRHKTGHIFPQNKILLYQSSVIT